MFPYWSHFDCATRCHLNLSLSTHDLFHRINQSLSSQFWHHSTVDSPSSTHQSDVDSDISSLVSEYFLDESGMNFKLSLKMCCMPSCWPDSISTCLCKQNVILPKKNHSYSFLTEVIYVYSHYLVLSRDQGNWNMIPCVVISMVHPMEYNIENHSTMRLQQQLGETGATVATEAIWAKNSRKLYKILHK